MNHRGNNRSSNRNRYYRHHGYIINRSPLAVIAALFFLVVFFPGLKLQAAKTFSFKGDYFLFSDDQKYIYGGGNIFVKGRVKGKTIRINGDALYMDVEKLCGVIYGRVTIEDKLAKSTQSDTSEKTGKKKTDSQQTDPKKQVYDAVFFQGMPPRFLRITFQDQITMTGDTALESAFINFIKKKPALLKDSSLYFEFREFRIDKNKKVKAKYVIPYMMGLPTMPLKKFTVNRGKWAEKTMIAFNSVNYTGADGLSVALFMRMREKFIKADYDVKLYERELFKMDGIKRGVLFSGKSGLLIKKKEILDISSLLNSGDQSFNLNFRHRMDFKFFSYSLSQKISGRKDVPVFFEFSSDLTLKKLKIIVPQFSFSHNLKNSYSYGASTPLKLWKKLTMNVGWNRKIINESYLSDTSNFTSSIGFNSPVLSVSSNYNFSKNLVEATTRKNFSVNLKLKPLRFLMDNVAIEMSSFYMFSAVPFGDQTQTRISPGVSFAVNSAGAGLPLGFKLIPSFTFNHLWDNREESFTDFNYGIALQKDVGVFSAALSYSLASRYRAENFWIEGNNRQNLNLNLLLKDQSYYSFLLRFYMNDKMALQNISFNGDIKLPFDFRFSSFVLYYYEEKKFNTVEIFLEKVFKKKIKIQGGYSLALKRFFVKFLTI